MIELYTKDNCSFCTKAKMLLDHNSLSYTEVDAVEHRDHLIERVTAATGQPPRTVPQIFINGEHVGGYTDLAKYLDVPIPTNLVN